MFCVVWDLSSAKLFQKIVFKSSLRENTISGGSWRGGSDPISQCYFVKNPIPIKDFFKIPTHISNVVYNNKPIK